jgi:hypothetical protein
MARMSAAWVYMANRAWLNMHSMGLHDAGVVLARTCLHRTYNEVGYIVKILGLETTCSAWTYTAQSCIAWMSGAWAWRERRLRKHYNGNGLAVLTIKRFADG